MGSPDDHVGDTSPTEAEQKAKRAAARRSRFLAAMQAAQGGGSSNQLAVATPAPQKATPTGSPPRDVQTIFARVVFRLLTLIAGILTLILRNDYGQTKSQCAASTVRERMGLESPAAFPWRLRRHLNRNRQMEPVW